MVTSKPGLLRLLGIAAVVAALAPDSFAQIAAGDLFPSLSSARLSGGPLPDTSGKVVVVDFWASWCAPCKASFPVYSRLQKQFAGQGLVIIGVSVDERAAAYSAFVAKYNPAFLTAHDSQQKLVSAVQVPTMPTCYLIDRSGRVRYVHAGFHGGETERELISEVQALLGAKAATP
jgi:thiol-disulfide isomerase/thioredoxin